MTSPGPGVGHPSKVLIVGAGMVGLSCAWSLQELGVEVEVIDRLHPAAGASWGNAGFISPALTVPLPEPSILRFGVRAVVDPRSPVAVPLLPGPEVLGFLAKMVRFCTTQQFHRALASYRPLNELIYEAFERQRDGGVDSPLVSADVLAGFARLGDAQGLMTEVEAVRSTGQKVDMELLTGDQARAREPHLAESITAAALIRDQRYLTPWAYVAALAEQVTARGGKIITDTEVTSVARQGSSAVVSAGDTRLEADAVIIANGAWMSRLATPHGVRSRVQAGRGYSFTVGLSEPLAGPLYLPATRVAIAPQGERARLVGVMEFARPDRAMVRSRIPHMVRMLKPLLRNIDLDHREDEWVGGRPLTPDGLPLVGATATPGVYVAGGHGMWGMTLGPLTGHLLSELIVTGKRPEELRPLNPLR